MKDRRTPSRQAAPMVEKMAAGMTGQTELFMLEYRLHDHWMSIRSQRLNDSICSEVDHQLLPYQLHIGGSKR